MNYEDAMVESGDSGQIKDLKRQICGLQAQLEIQKYRADTLRGGALLDSNAIDFYPGEQLDFLLSILEQIKDRCEPGSRPYDIICSLLEANRPVGRGSEILSELKRIFKNGGALSDSDISDLNAMGFTYTPSRKHPKLRFHEKYMFVLPGTPSDTRRGGINNLKEINKCIAVGLKV